jgi:hypothetical protein
MKLITKLLSLTLLLILKLLTFNCSNLKNQNHNHNHNSVFNPDNFGKDTRINNVVIGRVSIISNNTTNNTSSK